MKTFFSVLFLFSLTPFVNAGEGPPLNEQDCLTGYISTYEYDGDRVEIFFKNEIYLYTTRAASFQLLFSAFKNDMKVQIFTDSCHNEGGFVKFKIYPQ